MPRYPKSLTPLACALLAYAEQVQKQGGNDEEYQTFLTRDFKFSDDELKRMAMLASFGRLEEFKRDESA